MEGRIEIHFPGGYSENRLLYNVIQAKTKSQKILILALSEYLTFRGMNGDNPALVKTGATLKKSIETGSPSSKILKYVHKIVYDLEEYIKFHQMTFHPGYHNFYNRYYRAVKRFLRFLPVWSDDVSCFAISL